MTPTLMAVNVVSFSFSWCSTGGPGVHSAGCWLSLVHLISIFSGLQLIRAPSPFDLVWLYWNSNSTELYNSSTPTRSPTRSLKPRVWSSSSGNNCHAVHRSLSSGASIYECTMGFFSLSHFVRQFPLTRFPLLTAIGMCHFLPVHHLEWHFGPGRRLKYNTDDVAYLFSKWKLISGISVFNWYSYYILLYTHICRFTSTYMHIYM